MSCCRCWKRAITLGFAACSAIATGRTARAEELYWAEIVGRELADRATGEGFKLAGFEALRLALQRRLLKQFAQNTGLALDFGHVENLRHVATGRITGTELPGGWIAVSLNGRLALNPPQAANPCVAAGYCCSLTVPGEVTIPEARLWLRASLLAEEAAAEADETALLASHLIGGELELRNWRPGDRFQPSHSGNETKLKRLFSEESIPADQRSLWPVLVNGATIVWVRGFPVAHSHRWRPGSGPAVRIEMREMP